nr:hypothetical protein [Candidatus Sigynarchaeota archaeon]
MKSGWFSASIVVNFGLSAAAFMLVAFHIGGVVRDITTSGTLSLLLVFFIVPMFVVFLGILVEKWKPLLMICIMAAFEGSSYYVLVVFPNAAGNVGYRYDIMSIGIYALMLGSALSLFMVATADMAALARKNPSWPAFLGTGLTIPGIIVAAAISWSTGGWFHHLLLAMGIVPVSLSFYFKAYPLDQQRNVFMLEEPGEVSKRAIRDLLKGGKLALFTVITCANVLLMIGVNGLGQNMAFYVNMNWMFYVSTSIGVGIGVVVGWLRARALMQMPASNEQKSRDATISWLGALILQVMACIVALSLELIVPGYRGSAGAQMVDGITVGSILALYLVVIFPQHPPRAFRPFYMFMVYFIGFAMAVGNGVKAIVTTESDFRELIGYLPYVFAIEFAIMTWLVLYLLVPLRSSTSAVKKNPQKLDS